MMPTPTPRALRTRWAVARLHRTATATGEPARGNRPVQAMGLAFPSPIGLAAGFDRHGRLLECAHRLGFGAMELGTCTAASDVAGVPSPMLPPRPADRALRRGVSIGRGAGRDWAHAQADYLRALRAFHAGADYLTLNPGRDCPSPAHFVDVAAAVVEARDRLVRHRRRALPIVVKLPASWLGGNAERVAAGFAGSGADGLLVSAEGARSRAGVHACLARLADVAGPRLCLISVGGVDSVREVEARLRAGATLVQIHRALLTHDPSLVRALQRRYAGGGRTGR
jgi:dihydroorotate dehydrogenase